MTGASSGLGRAYALSLAARGHPLLLVARRGEMLAEVAERARTLHAVPSRLLVADLATPEGLAACREEMDAGPVDVAVLNAGFGSLGALADAGREREGRMVMLNCLAVLDLLRHALPGMVARGRGDLVVVSSAAAFQPVPFMATYAATKAFELHLSEAVAAEVRGTGVRVVAVCPGPTRTEFSDALTRDGGRTTARAAWPWWMPMDEAGDVVAATWRALDAGRPRVATGLVAGGARLGTLLPRRAVVGIADALHRARSRRKRRSTGEPG